MTEIGTQNEVIKNCTEEQPTPTKRGNHGMNKGKTYSRGSIEDDRARLYGCIIMMMLEMSGIPEYSSKYCNHIYSDHQKIAILILMSCENLRYYSLRKNLGKYQGFIDEIGLQHIPDGSTLCKFIKKMKKSDLQLIVSLFSRFIASIDMAILDTTGISNFERSAHYVFRCDDFGHKLAHRTFTKLSIVIDKDTRIVVSAEASVEASADTTFLPGHVEDLARQEIKPHYFLADKGYDSSDNLRIVKNNLVAIPVIPVRESRGNRGYSIHGPFRRDMYEKLKDKESAESKAYRYRPIIESTNFMIKNGTGSNIRERINESREKRAILKVCSFNIGRLIDLKLFHALA